MMLNMLSAVLSTFKITRKYPVLHQFINKKKKMSKEKSFFSSQMKDGKMQFYCQDMTISERSTQPFCKRTIPEPVKVGNGSSLFVLISAKVWQVSE